MLAAAAAAAQTPNAELTTIKGAGAPRGSRADLRSQTIDGDKSATERDRITGELQTAEVEIAEKRINLKDLERQREFNENRRAELDRAIAEREGELAAESGQLAAQVRAAYVNGGQERIKLLLNQQDPATLGRQLKYYAYLSAFRADNIERVNAHLVELEALRAEVAATEARLERVASQRQAELTALDAAQTRRRELLASLNRQLEMEGSEIERLAAQEQDLARLIEELTSILSDYPITSEETVQRPQGPADLAGVWPAVARLRAGASGRGRSLGTASSSLRRAAEKCARCTTAVSYSPIGLPAWGFS